ncbi:MAG: hypothetical protein AAB802_01035 [Patescibacteria group bacterium]
MKKLKKFGHFSVDKWKKLALSLSILIVLNVFFNVGIATFYDEPAYDDFCPSKLWNVSYNDRLSCEAVGGQWSESANMDPMTTESKPVIGYCNATFTCQEEYNEALGLYNRNVFMVLTILGAVAVITSFYLPISSAVLHGLMYGGVVSFLVGTMRYWSDMDDYLRFIVTGIVLIVLVGVGIRKVKD